LWLTIFKNLQGFPVQGFPMLPRPNWSRPLPRAMKIPGVMDLKALADVRALIGHLPKETRAKSTWQHVEAELKKAATGGDPAELWAALQMVLMLEGVEYRLK
jgi:hypothetical protein